MPKILIINGPNLNLLGKREPLVYGNKTLEDLNQHLKSLADQLKIEVMFYQSNVEGEIINYLHTHYENADGVIINPGAYTHYSYSIRDAISAIGITTIEVHISNIHDREEFRSKSVIAPVCNGSIVGFGFYGYAMALSYFADNLQKDQNE